MAEQGPVIVVERPYAANPASPRSAAFIDQDRAARRQIRQLERLIGLFGVQRGVIVAATLICEIGGSPRLVGLGLDCLVWSVCHELR